MALAVAAAAAAQAELFDPQRELGLQRLDRRVQGVRHRDVDRAGAVRVGAGALPAPDRLVVGEALAREGQVVHRSLSLGGDLDGAAECRDDEVGDPARGLDVAAGDGRRRTSMHEAPVRGGDLDRPVGSRRWRRVGVDQHPHREERRRLRHR